MTDAQDLRIAREIAALTATLQAHMAEQERQSASYRKEMADIWKQVRELDNRFDALNCPVHGERLVMVDRRLDQHDVKLRDHGEQLAALRRSPMQCDETGSADWREALLKNKRVWAAIMAIATAFGSGLAATVTFLGGLFGRGGQ